VLLSNVHKRKRICGKPHTSVKGLRKTVTVGLALSAKVETTKIDSDGN